MRAVICACFISLISGSIGLEFVPKSNEDWGIENIRPGAHLFWWLYLTTAPVLDYHERPLIVWLQGGPGMPSSGYGNFGEIGPLNLTLQERNYTWVKDFNVLFVDNPVGVGFSYAEYEEALCTNNTQIASDLVELLKLFFKKYPKFQEVPLYVFGESYGGKMAVEFVHEIVQKCSEGTMKANIKGVGLGNSWISPIDAFAHYASFLLYTGLVDFSGYEKINNIAQQIVESIEQDMIDVTIRLNNVFNEIVENETYNLDWYNILVKSDPLHLPSLYENDEIMTKLLNVHVRNALNITHSNTWKYNSAQVEYELIPDTFYSVTHLVEEILNSTSNIKIIVYNGLLDFIIPISSSLQWVNNLNWPKKSEWLNISRSALSVNGVYEGYVKTLEQLSFYWVARSGHSVPIDNPAAMYEILRRELLE